MRKKRRTSFGSHKLAENEYYDQGYVWLIIPGHSHADRNGRVHRSIINWEKANARPFPKGKIPHHINRKRYDDTPENILPVTLEEHRSLYNPNRKISGNVVKNKRKREKTEENESMD